MPGHDTLKGYLRDLITEYQRLGDLIYGRVFGPMYIVRNVSFLGDLRFNHLNVQELRQAEQALQSVEQYVREHREDDLQLEPITPSVAFCLERSRNIVTLLNQFPSSSIEEAIVEEKTLLENDVKGLLLEANILISRMSVLQTVEGILLSEGAVVRLRHDYEGWYARAMILIDSNLRERFRNEYEGKLLSPKIKAFLTAPRQHNLLLESATRSGSTIDMTNPFYWAYPFEATFEQPMRSQLALLRESSPREAAYSQVSSQVENSRQGAKGIGTVFIGHGHSLLYLKVERFLEKRLGLQTESFESEPRGGQHTVDVLEGMLERASFAVMVMTGDDHVESGNPRARQNVIHEVGLFQGRLGFTKVAVLRQRGTEDFSNIAGLTDLRFDDASIESVFEDLRAMLEREGVFAPEIRDGHEGDNRP
jgi:predicted nucleotide-binding protein